MSQPLKKINTYNSKEFNSQNKSPLSQEQIQDNYLRLQMVLMLVQLNSAYFQLGLALRKATDQLENRYKKIKLKVFLKLKHYKPDALDIRVEEADLKVQQKKREEAEALDELYMNLGGEDKHTTILKNISLQKVHIQILRNSVAVRCKIQLSCFINKIKNKRKNHLSFAFQKIYRIHEGTSGHILSQKSSRIDTNDSQKSKIFRRSIEKRSNRKSFSLDKSSINHKRQYFVPVKYHKNDDKSSLKEQPKQFATIQSAQNYSTLTKFLQNRGQQNSKQRSRRNLVGSDKSVMKCSSSKKLHMSTMINQKEEKIRQLQYLRGKYKKLMDQFSWFSARFLNVIEEQDLGQ